MKLKLNIDRCFGCHACEVACKQEHKLKVGEKRIKLREEVVESGGTIYWSYALITCQQCSEPLCRESCPSDAVGMTNNGLVLVDEALCEGCGICTSACPYEGIELSVDGGGVEKCDMCYKREGLPACVVSCPAKALTIVD